MDDLKDGFMLTGIIFAVISIIAILSRNAFDNDKELFKNVFYAIWGIIAFGLGSWLISFVFINILKVGFSIFGIFILIIPIIAVFIMGFLNKKTRL